MTDAELLKKCLAQMESLFNADVPLVVELREHVHTTYTSEERVNKTEKNEHEPVVEGWPLYSGLPKREWVGLTDEEVTELTYASIKEI